jgi:hypothetical protein
MSKEEAFYERLSSDGSMHRFDDSPPTEAGGKVSAG